METPDDRRTFTVAIVATGPSVRDQHIDGDLIIAVNSAIEIVEPDVWFALDPSPENMAIACAAPAADLTKIVAFPDDYQTPPAVKRLKRVSVPKRKERIPDESDAMYYIARWGCRLGLSENEDEIHTGNVAFGALGLAYHLRHELMGELFRYRIILYGVDGTDEERVTGGRPNPLDHLPLLFQSAKPQLMAAGIEVLNASPNSTVTCFDYYTASKVA